MTFKSLLMPLAILAATSTMALPSEDTHGTLDLKVAVQDELGIDTVSAVVELSHVQASQLEPFIRVRLSRWGAVQVNDALNTIIITDKPLKLKDLVSLVKRLDSPALKDFVRLDTVSLPMRYTDPAEFATSVRSQLSPEGSLVIDTAHNAFVITDVSSRILIVKAFVEKLDTFVPQAVMEVAVVESSDDSLRNAGLDWGVLNSLSLFINANGGSGVNSATNSGTSAGTSYQDFNGQNGFSTTNNSTNSGSNNASSSGSNWNVTGSLDVSAFLNLISNKNLGHVMLRTRLTGTNGTVARLTNNLGAISSVATSTAINNANNGLPRQEVPETDRQDGLSLVIQPRIGTGDVATLNVQAGVSSFMGWDGSNRPIYDTRSLSTQGVLRDGETLVLGGLQKIEEVEDDKGIPGLRTILPFIFSRRTTSRVQNDLLILLTVHLQKDIAQLPDAGPAKAKALFEKAGFSGATDLSPTAREVNP
jgi:type II secretory pathway component GspD/PulD (secretin)